MALCQLDVPLRQRCDDFVRCFLRRGKVHQDGFHLTEVGSELFLPSLLLGLLVKQELDGFLNVHGTPRRLV
jgi:hypothetical protein